LIYLDNNATTATDPAVVEVMVATLRRGPMNPSSQHAIGRIARNQLDDAISEIGDLLGADVDSPAGDQLVLTSGGSESNNLAIFGIGDPSAPLVVSAIEHASVLAVAAAMQQAGREVRVIPSFSSGVIDLEVARLLISKSPLPSLVSVMSANNETGVVQPTKVLANICNSMSIPLHVDATQSIGKLHFEFASSGASAVTFTAHKFHGPPGIGGLLMRSGLSLRPLIHGGEQQLGKRPGTESVALAIGMAMALRLAVRESASVTARLCSMRDAMEFQLARFIDGVMFHGQTEERLPGTSCFSLVGVDRQAMLMALDLAGVACSSGSACASGSSRPSHVLKAMGVSEQALESALRLGMSRFSTQDEVDSATETICLQYKRLRRF
jgi:cysteine desulfurase